MKEILEAIASGLKLDAEQFFADFKNGDDFISEKEAAAKLATFIPEKVKAANEGAKKVGRSEVNKRFSRLIKDSGFENPDSLEGEPLLTAFLEWKSEQSQHVDGDPGKMSREDLLKLPVVREILKEGERKASEKWTAEKTAFEARVAQAENTRKGFLLDKTLVSILEKGKVNLGDTPEQKALRLDFLKSRVDLGRLEIGDGDTLKFLDRDGYEADFEKEFLPVAQTAFGIVTQDKNKGGSGAQGSGTGGNRQGEKHTPIHQFPEGSKTFDALIFNAKNATERAEIHRDWHFLQKQESEKAAGKTPA